VAIAETDSVICYLLIFITNLRFQMIGKLEN